MPEHVSILQLLGVTVLALATVVWVVGLVRILRRSQLQITLWRDRGALRAMPHQRGATPPHLESVELTPAERDAFAGLIRQFSDDRS